MVHYWSTVDDDRCTMDHDVWPMVHLGRGVVHNWRTSHQDGIFTFSVLLLSSFLLFQLFQCSLFAPHCCNRTHSSETHSSETHSSGTHSSGTHSPGTHSSETHSCGIHSSGTHSSEIHSSETHSSETHSSGTHSSRA